MVPPKLEWSGSAEIGTPDAPVLLTLSVFIAGGGGGGLPPGGGGGIPPGGGGTPPPPQGPVLKVRIAESATLPVPLLLE